MINDLTSFIKEINETLEKNNKNNIENENVLLKTKIVTLEKMVEILKKYNNIDSSIPNCKWLSDK